MRKARFRSMVGLSLSLVLLLAACGGDDDGGGDSGTDAYVAWRRELGPIDLVLIDANHHYRAVRRDFEIERAQPHRFLALHDITGARRGTEGVARLWRELDGNKIEIVAPESKMGIGIWSGT